MPSHADIVLKVVVDNAVNHTWSIPEFQRGFVWKPSQVRELIESLWLDYPVGSLLIWQSGQEKTEERVAVDARPHNLWIVDGQQRTTALCILFGCKPYWWDSAEAWTKSRRDYDIRFDVDTETEPFFVVANAVIRKDKTKRYIPVSDLLNLDSRKDHDSEALEKLAQEVKDNGLCRDLSVTAVTRRLARVAQIGEQTKVITITIEHELEEVVEIFSRLNSKGTRVTEADIYLGVVAAKNKTWVRNKFLPYLGKLKEAGFDIDPNLLFRTITGIGAKKVRFREIDDAFWTPTHIAPAWDAAKDAWGNLLKNFREYGILSNGILPTQNALVTMTALRHKFPSQPFAPAFYWFLQASRFGRYSGSSATSLEEDLKDVESAASLKEAVQLMLKRFSHETPLDAEFFLENYISNRFGRLLLYLLIYQNEAQDWDEAGNRIGFDSTEVLASFIPQWHHIFPIKFLERGKVADQQINALANIAAIGASINIRISDKDPMDYITKYRITSEKLEQQFIEEDILSTPVTEYLNWLSARANKLAAMGNQYLESLKGDL